MAWLHAKPRPAPGSSRAETFDATTALSRLEQAKRSGIEPQMPPLLIPHIIERLTEVGLTSSNGMSATPLAWGEINEWARASAFVISAWEKRLIRALSVAYVAESHRADVETCPPPWLAGSTEATKAAEVAALDLLF